jgi:hypothetical protein
MYGVLTFAIPHSGERESALSTASAELVKSLENLLKGLMYGAEAEAGEGQEGGGAEPRNTGKQIGGGHMRA